jgi:hypothetical protein
VTNPRKAHYISYDLLVSLYTRITVAILQLILAESCGIYLVGDLPPFAPIALGLAVKCGRFRIAAPFRSELRN